jgi:hypothetical protein
MHDESRDILVCKIKSPCSSSDVPPQTCSGRTRVRRELRREQPIDRLPGQRLQAASRTSYLHANISIPYSDISLYDMCLRM